MSIYIISVWFKLVNEMIDAIPPPHNRITTDTLPKGNNFCFANSLRFRLAHLIKHSASLT